MINYTIKKIRAKQTNNPEVGEEIEALGNDMSFIKWHTFIYWQGPNSPSLLHFQIQTTFHFITKEFSYRQK